MTLLEKLKAELERESEAERIDGESKLPELHGLLCECVGALEKFRNEPKDWRVPKGPGGQDRYVGLPPGFRYFDDALSKLESYLEKREGGL